MAGFQVGPAQRDPTALRNPYLDEIDAAANNAHATLSPGAQAALQKAGAPLPAAPAPTPQITGPRPATPTLGPTPAPAPVPVAPTNPANVQDLVRLTKPDTGLHNKENTGTAGVNQIHNPWARVPLQILDAIGSGFAPGLTSAIPGTQLHHQALIGGRENALKQDEVQRESQEKAQTAAATQGHLEAETENQRAQALREHQAPHPTITTDKGIMQWNPQTNRFDIPAGNAPEKEEMAGRTITTDQGIMQWNPATKSYDIKAGDAPEKEAAEKTLQDAEGTWYKVGRDNTAVPITLNGQPFKGKMPAAAGDDFAQFYQKYLKEKGLPDSATNEKKARTEWATSSQAPERPPQALMLVPGENGNMNAQVIRPGSTVSGGAMTPGGLSTENATPAAMRNREGQARIIKTAGDQLIASIEQNRASLGNLGSYWNQYTNGTPIADPKTAGLMAQLASFAALQPTLHGFRSEAALKGFEDIIGGVPKNPDALEAAIKAIQGTAAIIATGGGREFQQGGGPAKTAEGGYQIGHKYGGLEYLGGPVNDKANWK
jgi:hypothetical protein